MPFSALGKNAMLNNLGVDRVGAFQKGTDLTAVTGVTSTDTFTKTAHGLANGTLVVLTAMTGGTGLKAGNAGNADENAEPLFVVATAANTFQLSRTPGGSAADLGTDISAVTVSPLVELTGGSPAYARVAIAYAAAADGQIDDSTNGANLNVPALGSVNYLGYWNNGSSELRAIDLVPTETYTGQGVYTVTDSKHNLNA